MPSDLGTPFRRTWAAAGTSNVADGLVLVGAPLIAVQLTRSPLLVSLVTTAASLPWLLLALHAGAAADRLPRRTLIAVANAVRALALAAAALLAATGHLGLPALCAAVLVFGVCEVFADTSAQSLVPSLVGRDRLEAANSRLVATETVGNNFLGAPVAGVLASVGAAAVLAVPAACYAAASALILTVRPPRPPGGPDDDGPAQNRAAPGADAAVRTTVRADIAVGLRYLLGHRTLRALAVLAGVSSLAGGAYFAVFVLWVVGPTSAVGLTSAGYGLLAALLAAGAVLGSVLAQPLSRRLGAQRAMLAGFAVELVVQVVPVLLPTVAALAPAVFVLGVGNAVGTIGVITMRQRLVPDALLGRVNATYRLVGSGATPLGALAGGLLGQAAGLPAVFLGATALALVAVAALARPVSAPVESSSWYEQATLVMIIKVLRSSCLRRCCQRSTATSRVLDDSGGRYVTVLPHLPHPGAASRQQPPARAGRGGRCPARWRGRCRSNGGPSGPEDQRRPATGSRAPPR